MGLGTRERKTYLRMSKGKLRMVVPEGTPNAVRVEVTDDNGNVTKIKWELQWDTIQGRIIGASVVKNQEPKYADNFCLHIDDGMNKYVVQMSVDSGLYKKLLNKLCNPIIDWNKQMIISPFFFEDENKAAVTVEQNGEKIPAYFTREEPKGMPQFEAGTFDDKGNVLDKNKLKIGLIQIHIFLENYFFSNVSQLINTEPVINENIPQDNDGLPPSDYIPKAETTADKPKTKGTAATNTEADDLPFIITIFLAVSSLMPYFLS